MLTSTVLLKQTTHRPAKIKATWVCVLVPMRTAVLLAVLGAGGIILPKEGLTHVVAAGRSLLLSAAAAVNGAPESFLQLLNCKCVTKSEATGVK